MSLAQQSLPEDLQSPSLLARLQPYDWIWGLLVMAGVAITLLLYYQQMDGYDLGILLLCAPALIWMGWGWGSFRTYSLLVCSVSILTLWVYDGQLSNAEQTFLLRYLLSSQSAIMWMSALFVMATAGYAFGLAARSEFSNQVATALTWSASIMGMSGLMVRWHESYLLGSDIGHIPVSNLYEVFILFAVVTALLYLYYEQLYRTRALGAFALTIISAAVAFILWYAFERGGHQIQPLVPALQSYWMKLHVPTNFIGYGAFALAAVVGVAYLVQQRRHQQDGAGRLPRLELLDTLIYKLIALGFAFFTVATVLGAMWAAEAWGGYWSWDPKETWALIVWLNYAAWLHLRLTKGWRGTPLAWWAIAGFFITLFAFLGVNMFLSGLHSYGEL